MEEMNKQGLFFWLKSVVESGRCPGVAWVNIEEGTFQIPWSNQKSRSWQKEDSSVFLEYAKHTSKYKPGDKMDFPKWKQNLKSAINKNRFIERLREQDRLSGTRPYRVYRFINEKMVRKKSDDIISDFTKSMAINKALNQYHSFTKADDGVVSNEVFAHERSMSTNSSFLSYPESGSASSPGPTISLSPDILRDDFCDQPHGNIPTVVDSYCGDSDPLCGEENQNTFAVMSESCSPVTTHIAGTNTDSSTVQAMNQDREVSEYIAETISHSSAKTVENENYSDRSLQVLLQQPFPKNLQLNTLPQVAVVTSQIMAPYSTSTIESRCYAPLIKEFGSSVPVMTSATLSGVVQNLGIGNHAPIQKSTSGSSIPIQKSATHSDEVQIMGVGYQAAIQKSDFGSRVFLSPGFGCPSTILANALSPDVASSVTSLQKNVSDKNKIESGMPLQRKELGSMSAFNSNCTINTTTVCDTQIVSFSELQMHGEYSSDLPSSMDTGEQISYSDKQAFTSSQFTTLRGRQMPSVTQNKISSQRTVNPPHDESVHVEVLYGTPHQTVIKHKLTPYRSSCRLFYGSVNTPVMQNVIRGQQDAEEIELPSVDTLNYSQEIKTVIHKILKDMELGIIISYRNKDIYVERRCLPRVYLSDGVSKSESLLRSTKKRPDVDTKVFDFNNFKESISHNDGPIPKDHILLTIGYEIIPNDDSPTRKVPIYIVVRHVEAAYERFNILGASTIAPNPMCSDPNSFDKNVALFKELDLKKN